MNDNGQKLELKVSDSMRFVFESRGAMGLELLYRTSADGIVAITRVPDDSPAAPPPRPGDPVSAVFEIKGVKCGDVEITFYETRPWEKSFPEILQKTIRISVTN